MTGTTRTMSSVTLDAAKTQAHSRTLRDYQQTFNQLPEQRKHELARVVAGMTQVQGRVAAQRWLEQRLEDCITPTISRYRLPHLKYWRTGQHGRRR